MNGGTSALYLTRTLAFPCFALCLIGVETEGLLDYEGRTGIISIVQWNLRPVMFGVEGCEAWRTHFPSRTDPFSVDLAHNTHNL